MLRIRRVLVRIVERRSVPTIRLSTVIVGIHIKQGKEVIKMVPLRDPVVVRVRRVLRAKPEKDVVVSLVVPVRGIRTGEVVERKPEVMNLESILVVDAVIQRLKETVFLAIGERKAPLNDSLTRKLMSFLMRGASATKRIKSGSPHPPAVVSGAVLATESASAVMPMPSPPLASTILGPKRRQGKERRAKTPSPNLSFTLFVIM